MIQQKIKELLKPTKLKIITTFIVIIAYVISNRIIIGSGLLDQLIYLKIYKIIFAPFSVIHQIIKNICSLFFNQSFCDITNNFSPLVVFSIILDIFLFYFLACLLIYILYVYKKSGKK
ncbi:hypothetical protein KJ854_05890 [Patescibacteria group bacterium]|nr:hypothetical protein [Patescibacteria group bacterium]